MSDKKDKKIIPFPRVSDKDKVPDKKWKFNEKGLLPFLAGAIIIPIFVGLLLPSWGRNIGNTKITESYVMPYSYAQDAKFVNYNVPVTEIDAEQVFNYACALRTCFSCSKISMAMATDNALNIHKIEKFGQDKITYPCLTDGKNVNFYSINSGDQASNPVKMTISAEMSEGERYYESVPVEMKALGEFQPQEPFPVEIAAIEGGDGVNYFSLKLNDWALQELRMGKKIIFSGAYELEGKEMLLSLGILTFYEGKLIIENGGAGGDEPVDYVYIDVEQTEDGDIIPINTAFQIQDRAVADTIILPSRSCRLTYSMTYEVDGKPLTTTQVTSKVFVPRYKDLAFMEVANYMQDNNITFYKYGSDPELHKRAAYEPEALQEELKTKE